MTTAPAPAATATAPAGPLPGPRQLAARVLARIEAGEHDQGIWVAWPGAAEWEAVHGPAGYVAEAGLARGHLGCGTTACAAGWAVLEALEAGYGLDHDEAIDEAAARLLGIDPLIDHIDLPGGGGRHLFCGHTTEAEVKAGLAAIADGAADRAGLPDPAYERYWVEDDVDTAGDPQLTH